MLLPPLRERMELLHSLLPQGPDRWESLSKGQVRSSKNMPESSWGMLWVFLWDILSCEVSLMCRVHMRFWGDAGQGAA